VKSVSMPWTRMFFNSACPCGSGQKSFKCCWRGDGQWEKTPVGPVVIPANSEPSVVNDRCYLSVLGNCSSRITKEHFISRNILERLTNSTLRIEGAGHIFGGKDTVEIGIDGFSAKVPCDKHNSALGALDSAAEAAFSTIEALKDNLLRFSKGSRIMKSLHISSGLDIERWMVKVYCGLLAAGKIRSKSGRALEMAQVGQPLIESLVGTQALAFPLGLYLHSFADQPRRLGGISIGTVQLADGSDGVGGLMLSLGPINLVLVVSEQYGRTFIDKNWFRHQTLSWKINEKGSRVTYLFTY